MSVKSFVWASKVSPLSLITVLPRNEACWNDCIRVNTARTFGMPLRPRGESSASEKPLHPTESRVALPFVGCVLRLALCCDSLILLHLAEVFQVSSAILLLAVLYLFATAVAVKEG